MVRDATGRGCGAHVSAASDGGEEPTCRGVARPDADALVSVGSTVVAVRGLAVDAA
jgi:hypothetical protein